jgi:acyl-CoA synthetase (AMP-forming)/AMP-acid ligase II
VTRSPDESGGEVPEVLMVSKVRVVEFIDEILKSSSGKIVRRVLVERDRAAIPST